jgi:hypothetical protein
VWREPFGFASSVASVQLELDGVLLGAEDTVAPFESLWNAADSSMAFTR